MNVDRVSDKKAVTPYSFLHGNIYVKYSIFVL